MRSRDLIDGFDYGEYMQRQMFCFGSSEDTDSGADSRPTYSGNLDFSEEDYSITNSVASTSGPTGNGGNDSYDTISRAAAKDFGTPDPTQEQITQSRGFDTGSQASRDVIMGIGQLSEIDALKQLNADLQDLSRREAKAKAMMSYNPVAGYIALQNVRNLAATAAGYPQGLLSSIGITPREIGSGLDPSALASLQSRNLRGPTGRDPFGRTTSGIMAITDEFGNVIVGIDPRGDSINAGDRDDGTQTVKPVNPVTGQCDAGYIFDEQLNACRLDTRGGAGAPGDVGSVVPPADGAYARMGLLDVAPTGLP